MGKTTDLHVKHYMTPLPLSSSLPSSLPLGTTQKLQYFRLWLHAAAFFVKVTMGKTQLREEPSLDFYFDNPQKECKYGEVSRIVP